MAIILNPLESQWATMTQEDILHIIVTDETIRTFDLNKKPVRVLITLNWLEQWEWEWEDYIISEQQIIFQSWCNYQIWDKMSIRYY
jgi:hypothetical protein